MENNTFISKRGFREKFDWNIDYMHYLGLKKSIPKEWISLVEKTPNTNATKKHNQDLLNKLESKQIIGI